MLAYQAQDIGDDKRALALAEESLTVARELRVYNCILWPLVFMVFHYARRGDLGRAQLLAEEVVGMARDSATLIFLGGLARDAGDYPRAEELFLEALSTSSQVGRR